MTILVYSPPFKSKRGIPRVVNRGKCGHCQISFDREMVSVFTLITPGECNPPLCEIA